MAQQSHSSAILTGRTYSSRICKPRQVASGRKGSPSSPEARGPQVGRLPHLSFLPFRSGESGGCRGSHPTVRVAPPHARSHARGGSDSPPLGTTRRGSDQAASGGALPPLSHRGATQSGPVNGQKHAQPPTHAHNREGRPSAAPFLATDDLHRGGEVGGVGGARWRGKADGVHQGCSPRCHTPSSLSPQARPTGGEPRIGAPLACWRHTRPIMVCPVCATPHCRRHRWRGTHGGGVDSKPPWPRARWAYVW